MRSVVNLIGKAKMNIIVAGIGTGVGKTVVSGIVCQALNADYWKPVQAGDLDNSDSHKVQSMLAACGNSQSQILPETYSLSQPMSPHAAAQIDQIEIELDTLLSAAPSAGRTTVIELAGGLMVPLSQTLSTIDFVSALNSPVLLVADYYLGSINHTLLSLHLLESHKINVLGIIFNGQKAPASQQLILSQSGVKLIAEIPATDQVDNADFIQTHARQIQQHF